MVSHDVSEMTPGALLVARLHVDLCRLSSAICPGRSLPTGPTA
ncbi:putative leader peptide [Streptomyces sp. NPDC060198]